MSGYEFLDTLMLGLEETAARAQAAKDARDRASKNAGTSAMDARAKTKDSEAVAVRTELESLLTQVKEKRQALDARLVEIGELSGEAAALDELRAAARRLEDIVRKQFAMFTKTGLLDTAPVEYAERVEALARPIIGQDRGRKAESEDTDSE